MPFQLDEFSLFCYLNPPPGGSLESGFEGARNSDSFLGHAPETLQVKHATVQAVAPNLSRLVVTLGPVSPSEIPEKPTVKFSRFAWHFYPETPQTSGLEGRLDEFGREIRELNQKIGNISHWAEQAEIRLSQPR